MSLWMAVTGSLLGWKYVEFKYGADSHVRRIRYTAEGRAFVVLYGKYIYMDDGDRAFTPLNFRRDAL